MAENKKGYIVAFRDEKDNSKFPSMSKRNLAMVLGKPFHNENVPILHGYMVSNTSVASSCDELKDHSNSRGRCYYTSAEIPKRQVIFENDVINAFSTIREMTENGESIDWNKIDLNFHYLPFGQYYAIHSDKPLDIKRSLISEMIREVPSSIVEAILNDEASDNILGKALEREKSQDALFGRMKESLTEAEFHAAGHKIWTPAKKAVRDKLVKAGYSEEDIYTFFNRRRSWVG